MLLAGSVALVLYTSLLLELLGSRVFSNFYDLQARALLDGRFDVPPGSLGIEAFVVDGRHYLYFPPGPALLRMPLLAVTDRFDGRLTAVSMLLAWLVTGVILALLLWRVRTILRPDTRLGRWEAAAYGLFFVAGTAGTTILFLASIPWVYHEAYAWAVAMALGSAFCLLGVIQRPTNAGLIATGLFTTGAVLSRTTAGWAVAGAVLLTAVLLPRARHHEDRNLWWKVYVAGLVPVAVGMAVNWAKFRHPFLFPIESQVFTSLNSHRRDAIAANGGDLFSPTMIWSTLVNYLRPDGIRFTTVYPFITLPDRIAPSYGGGFIDQANRTGSIVAFMPMLVGLTIWGLVGTYRRRAWPGSEHLRLPLLGVLAIPGGIMFYAYIAHRYTSEFVPLLLFGASVGLVDVLRRLGPRSRRVRLLALGAMAVLVLFSVVATRAVALNNRALANPGPVLLGYVEDQERLSARMGDTIDGNVTRSSRLSLEGRADELRIIDDCQALYVGAGDEFRPWEEAAVRPLRLRLTVDGAGDALTTSVPLGTFEGHRGTTLLLERVRDEGVRLLLRGDAGRSRTEFVPVEDGETFTVEVATDDPLNYLITGPSGIELELPKQTYDVDWRWLPIVFRPAEVDPSAFAAMGLDVTQEPTPPIAVCERLAPLATDVEVEPEGG